MLVLRGNDLSVAPIDKRRSNRSLAFSTALQSKPRSNTSPRTHRRARWQRDRLREELTLAKIDHHAEAVEELDVEGILAFAERILPPASDLWVAGPSLDYKQRLQQLVFPEGIAFDGNRFNRTAATALRADPG